jgi:hypothetical protein
MPDGSLEELRKDAGMSAVALLLAAALIFTSLYKAYLFSPVLSVFLAVIWCLCLIFLRESNRKDRTELVKFAEENGFEVLRPGPDFWQNCPVLAFFCHGVEQTASSCLRIKTEKEHILIFNYFVKYLIQGHAHQSVCVINSAGSSLPDFILARKTLFSDFLKKITPDKTKVYFDDPRFSEQFVLTSNDPVRTREYFSLEIRNWLARKEGEIYLESYKNAVLFHRNEVLEKNEFNSLLKETREIAMKLAAAGSNL